MKLSNEEIAAKDLRVGNRLNKDGIVVCIDARSILDIAYNYSEACKYKPIPLTPDILERCGFEIYDDTNITLNKTYRYGKLGLELRDAGYYTIMWYDANDDYGTVIFVKIKHLHQLQNLYHALTGEELDLSIAISKNEVK